MVGTELPNCGAIVLCGGDSVRMGRDKASLPFGPHATLLGRVVDVLRGIVPAEHIVVVAGREQTVPSLAASVVVVHEARNGAGPLLALVEGMERLPAGVDAAFACGCDAPLLQPAFIRRLFELRKSSVEVVVPADDDRWHPLAAVYGTSCLVGLRAALKAGERSLHRALRGDHVQARAIPVGDLREGDPQLQSLINCNAPEQYERALRLAGLSSA